ncbi:MAG: AzlC family ABC transporter permease [Eubacteriaceae bacterium]|nr:AzlC family ABC transporter permease [Eubacteriaceae bacterium]
MSIKDGFKSAVPVMMGYIPLAIAYGVLGKAAGLPDALIVLLSIMVFAGASQFLAISLFAGGVLPLEIIFTTFIINSRHMIMSTSLSRKLEDHMGIFKRGVIAFGVTDETFSVSSVQGKDRKLNARYLIGLNFSSYFAWVAGTVIGIFFSSILPASLEASMGIALYALFIALLFPSAFRSKHIMILVVITGIFHILIAFYFTSNGKPTGWTIVISSLIGAFIGIFFIEEDEIHG